MARQSRSLLAVVVSCGLIVAACGGAEVATPTASAPPKPAITASPTPTPGPKASTVKIVPGPKFPSQRYQFAAARLADGRILLAGGYLPADWRKACGNVHITNGACVAPATASAEIYDPATKTFTATGSMSVPRRGHRAVLLHDGRVLVVGGLDSVGRSLGTAEVFDPATGTFASMGKLNQDTSGDAPPMISPDPSNEWRTKVLQDQTVTVLADGRVLIAGGADDLGDSSNAATIFDPRANTFSNLPGMPRRWQDAEASLLPNGKVLLAGGMDSTSNRPTTDALLFDPATNSFAVVGPTVVALKGGTQTVLRDGRVFIANGMIDPNNLQPNCGAVIPAQLYTPGTGKFTRASATNPTEGEAPILIPDGRVLLLGGIAGDKDCSDLRQVEAFDPDNGTISLLASGVLPQGGVAAVFLLADGSVFLIVDLMGGGAGTYVLTLE